LFSIRAALAVDPGFEADGVLTGLVSLPASRYPDEGARTRFWDRLRDEVEALPAVATAGFSNSLPFSGSQSSSVITPEGYAPRPGESLLSPVYSVVSPGYFEAMGIDVLEGRALLPSDGPDDRRVIVIDRWLADRYWPEGDALGQRMIWGAIPGQDSIPEDAFYTIVGIVETIKHRELTTPVDEHVGAYYLPYAQVSTSTVTLVADARTGQAEALTPAIRGVLQELDPELPFFGVQSMQSRVDESLAGRRVPLILLGVFAAVALFLAVVGIYGALAYSVGQRTREIGIRMAMGSQPERVFKDVVAQGLTVTGVGLAAGAATALLLARFIQSLLYGIEATDPRVMAGVVLLLATVSLVACVLPARRATRVDPVSALTGT
ncbi:MAG: FtsX-like permease family protein, partial [Longimicrobiales bacterium]|nr:FtsX-like permease family protein [Longimicrobiales bacterium]